MLSDFGFPGIVPGVPKRKGSNLGFLDQRLALDWVAKGLPRDSQGRDSQERINRVLCRLTRHGDLILDLRASPPERQRTVQIQEYGEFNT
jgi:hypothetical protein